MDKLFIPPITEFPRLKSTALGNGEESITVNMSARVKLLLEGKGNEKDLLSHIIETIMDANQTKDGRDKIKYEEAAVAAQNWINIAKACGFLKDLPQKSR